MHSYGGYYLTLLHHGITHSFLCKLSMKRISYTYIKDRSSAIDRRVIERSQQRSPTQSLKKEAICRRRAIYPARELAIFVIFFFAWLPCIHFSFNYFYRFSRHRRTYCKNPRVKMSNIVVLWDLENHQNWIQDFFFLSFHISAPPIFIHYLIELEW